MISHSTGRRRARRGGAGGRRQKPVVFSGSVCATYKQARCWPLNATRWHLHISISPCCWRRKRTDPLREENVRGRRKKNGKTCLRCSRLLSTLYPTRHILFCRLGMNILLSRRLWNHLFNVLHNTKRCLALVAKPWWRILMHPRCSWTPSPSATV